MKILLIGVNNSGLVLPIVEEMRRQGHEVCYLENGEISCYEYLYPAERLLNSLAKGVLGRNLKRERRWLATTQFLNGFLKDRHFDLTILTNPDIYTAEHLAMLKRCTGRLVCHLWDSAGRMPGNLHCIEQFDRVMSFDPKDIRERGFTAVTNYAPPGLQPLAADRPVEGDLFGIFSFDRERYRFICQLLDANPQLKIRIMLLADHKRKVREASDPRVEVITKPVVGEALQAISSAYRAILDVGYASQQGLSFRFFEALAQQQKLVTNNASVMAYPFFRAENIYCLQGADLTIPPAFFATPYQTLPEEIIGQYRLEQWVSNLLELMME